MDESKENILSLYSVDTHKEQVSCEEPTSHSVESVDPLMIEPNADPLFIAPESNFDNLIFPLDNRICLDTLSNNSHSDFFQCCISEKADQTSLVDSSHRTIKEDLKQSSNDAVELKDTNSIIDPQTSCFASSEKSSAESSLPNDIETESVKPNQISWIMDTLLEPASGDEDNEKKPDITTFHAKDNIEENENGIISSAVTDALTKVSLRKTPDDSMLKKQKSALKCLKCDFSTNWPSQLRSHYKKHNLGTIMVCQKCNFSTHNKKHMTSHTASCSLSVKGSKKRKNSKILCTKNRIKFKVMPTSLSNIEKLEENVSPDSSKKIASNGEKKCKKEDIDSNEFKKKSSSQPSLKFKHAKDKILNCPYCSYTSKWRSSIYRHKLMHARKHTLVENKSVIVTKGNKSNIMEAIGMKMADNPKEVRNKLADLKEERKDSLDNCTSNSLKQGFSDKSKKLNASTAKLTPQPEEKKNLYLVEKASLEQTKAVNGKRVDSEESVGTIDESLPSPLIKNNFSCLKCLFKTNYRSNLTRHYRLFHGSTLTNINLHNKKKKVAFPTGKLELGTSYPFVKIKPLGKKFLTHKKLEKAPDKKRKIGSDQKKYRCFTCNYKTAWYSALHRHVKSQGHTGLFYSCPQCPFKTDRLEIKKDHLSIHKLNYRCLQCGFKVHDYAVLKQHVALYHPDLLSHELIKQEVTKPLYCVQCPYTANSKSKLVRHMKTHYKKSLLKFKCKYCPYGCNKENLLKAHLEKYNNMSHYYGQPVKTLTQEASLENVQETNKTCLSVDDHNQELGHYSKIISTVNDCSEVRDETTSVCNEEAIEDIAMKDQKQDAKNHYQTVDEIDECTKVKAAGDESDTESTQDNFAVEEHKEENYPLRIPVANEVGKTEVEIIGLNLQQPMQDLVNQTAISDHDKQLSEKDSSSASCDTPIRKLQIERKSNIIMSGKKGVAILMPYDTIKGDEPTSNNFCNMDSLNDSEKVSFRKIIKYKVIPIKKYKGEIKGLSMVHPSNKETAEHIPKFSDVSRVQEHICTKAESPDSLRVKPIFKDIKTSHSAGTPKVRPIFKYTKLKVNSKFSDISKVQSVIAKEYGCANTNSSGNSEVNNILEEYISSNSGSRDTIKDNTKLSYPVTLKVQPIFKKSINSKSWCDNTPNVLANIKKEEDEKSFSSGSSKIQPISEGNIAESKSSNISKIRPIFRKRVHAKSVSLSSSKGIVLEENDCTKAKAQLNNTLSTSNDPKDGGVLDCQVKAIKKEPEPLSMKSLNPVLLPKVGASPQNLVCFECGYQTSFRSNYRRHCSQHTKTKCFNAKALTGKFMKRLGATKRVGLKVKFSKSNDKECRNMDRNCQNTSTSKANNSELISSRKPHEVHMFEIDQFSNGDLNIKKEESESESLRCDYCNFNTSVKQSLKDHILTCTAMKDRSKVSPQVPDHNDGAQLESNVHSSGKSQFKRILDKKSDGTVVKRKRSKTNKWNKNDWNKENNSPASQETKLDSVEKCSENNPSDFAKHKLADLKYSCSKCTFRTTHVNSLTKHMLRHTIQTMKRFKCPKCVYGSNSENLFLRHQLKFTGSNNSCYARLARKHKLLDSQKREMIVHNINATEETEKSLPIEIKHEASEAKLQENHNSQTDVSISDANVVSTSRKKKVMEIAPSSSSDRKPMLRPRSNAKSKKSIKCDSVLGDSQKPQTIKYQGSSSENSQTRLNGKVDSSNEVANDYHCVHCNYATSQRMTMKNHESKCPNKERRVSTRIKTRSNYVTVKKEVEAEESPGVKEVAEESAGVKEVTEESPGVKEVAEESPGVKEVAEEGVIGPKESCNAYQNEGLHNESEESIITSKISDNSVKKSPMDKNNVLKCLECDFSTSCHIKLSDHSTHHRKSCTSSVRDASKCSLCNYIAPSNTAMLRHIIVKHPPIKTNKDLHACSKCNFKASCPSDIESHYATHHKVELKELPEIKKEINEFEEHNDAQANMLKKCEKFPEEINFEPSKFEKLHEQINLNVGELDNIEKLQDKKSSLERNMNSECKNRSINNSINTIIEEAKKIYNNTNQGSEEKIPLVPKDMTKSNTSSDQESRILFNPNIIIKTEEGVWTRIYKCLTCPYETKEKFNMQVHVDAFSHESFLFSCTKCSFMGKTKEALQTHKLCHTMPKYHCPHCDFKTTLKRTLIQHTASSHGV